MCVSFKDKFHVENLFFFTWEAIKIVNNQDIYIFLISDPTAEYFHWLFNLKSFVLQLVAFKKNPFAYAAGSDNLKDVISFNQKSGSNKMQERTYGTVTIGFSQKNITWKWTQPMSNNSKMIFHIFNYR